MPAHVSSASFRIGCPTEAVAWFHRGFRPGADIEWQATGEIRKLSQLLIKNPHQRVPSVEQLIKGDVLTRADAEKRQSLPWKVFVDVGLRLYHPAFNKVELPYMSTELALDIYNACHLVGDFVLRSGRHASEYFDKYQISANPMLLGRVTHEMVRLIPSDVQVLAGLELGAVPVVAMLSQLSGVPAAYVRKAPKTYGTRRLAEGARIDGRKVLIVEDVVTSGGQVLLSCTELRRLGAIVTHALVIIDRDEGAREGLMRSGIELVSLFNRSDFPR